MKPDNRSSPYYHPQGHVPEAHYQGLHCPHCHAQTGEWAGIASTSTTTGCCEYQVYLYLRRKFNPWYRFWAWLDYGLRFNVWR